MCRNQNETPDLSFPPDPFWFLGPGFELFRLRLGAKADALNGTAADEGAHERLERFRRVLAMQLHSYLDLLPSRVMTLSVSTQRSNGAFQLRSQPGGLIQGPAPFQLPFWPK